MDSMIVTYEITPDIFGRKRYQAESKSHFITPHPRRAYSRDAAQRKLLKDMVAESRGTPTFMQRRGLAIKAIFVAKYDDVCTQLDRDRRTRY